MDVEMMKVQLYHEAVRYTCTEIGGGFLLYSIN